ncbi:hypothetical protein A3C26_03035 [Candidatus Daviesbacteria bacterium RIFCSPHIGHO2_02_FULL_39_12]|uniref:DNA 3'-5' helicase n=2 Tax=Candidatus Daviesiibacteriota TaxID=1752718 RepID=A0A1F5JE49_9BACT|nr:MAG: hypothetical protein A3C26_03035 [Candidatus Daviesbacteria bacterium RIFCSPHIGHO2_02_FULL_39_12]OGE71440.1 MAG: hypothetical protein A3H40_02845 [Candidatus Daviesbacteria bacterium RIFCSPLOWO2_02_FULL_38_15]
MTTNEFKKAYKNLNSAQKLAVDEIEGPIMVIAGPGTGKTEVLTLRIVNILLNSQVNPENILALTFSESASFEMRSRLSEIIGTPAFRVEVVTFHSFSNGVIKNYPDEFPLLLSSENITETEQIELIEKIINQLDLKLLRPFGDPVYYLKDILGAINDLKKEGVTPEKLKDSINKQKKDFEEIEDIYYEKGKYKGEMKGKYADLKKDIEKVEEFFSIFDSYQKILAEEKKYDFNDMLLEVIKALELNKSLLLRLQEKYQYILIDEHQDTNAAQNRLMELILSFYKNPNIFVVGDEKQAIYRFQGASLENFLYFRKIYPSVKLINLQENYRSHQLILNAAGSLIAKNISANILPQKKLRANCDTKAQKIKLAAVSSYDSEYEYIASDIKEKITKGFNPSEIAVLARRNSDLIPLARSLNRLGIKFIIQSDQNILNDLEIQKLILIFQSIANPMDESLLIKMLHVNFLKIDPFDVYKLIGNSKKQKKAFSKVIEKINKRIIKELDLKQAVVLSSLYSKYKNWICENDNVPFDNLFIKVVNESGFKEFILKSSDRYQLLNRLNGLFDEIKLRLYKNPKFNLIEFINLLQIVEKHKVALRTKIEHSREEGIRLLTVHKSKGLEFEWVYIINCFDGRWGNSRKRGAKIKLPWKYLGADVKAEISFEEIEDERRLFYVAMTRAKRGITLTFSKFGIDGKEQLPSQFIEEIESEFTEIIDTSKFEKSFDKAQIFDLTASAKLDPKNKEYLKQLFYEKGLSVTGLGNFLTCPWKYFFRNLISLPDVKNKSLILGTAIHATLDSFIKFRRTKSLNEQYLIDKFRELLEKEAISDEDRIELLKKGERALKLFYEKIIPTWTENIQSEMNIKGVKLSEGIILNGRLDMIEQLSKTGSVRVHDFKTGKIKSRSQIDGTRADSKYNYKRQLVFYRVLLDRYKEGLFKMREGAIDFVEPNGKGDFKSEIFSITEEDVRELESVIKSVGSQIINLTFWEQKCGDDNCEDCRLKEMVFNLPA